MMKCLLKKTIDRLSNTSGSILPTAGVLMPVLALATMATVEISNTYNVRNKMQASLDSAILAAAVETMKMHSNSTPAEVEKTAKEKFEAYYSANFSSLMKASSPIKLKPTDYSLKYLPDDHKLEVDVNLEFKSIAMKAFNLGKVNLGVDGSTGLSLTPENYVIDIVMCIDATGSMGATIAGVQAQANSFDADVRKELGGLADNFKIRVRPIYYRDYTDSTKISASSFIDLDPSKESGLQKNKQIDKFKAFIASQSAAGGGDWPEAAGACLYRGINSSWFDNQSQESFDYFEVDKDKSIIIDGSETVSTPDPDKDYVKVSTIPVIVFWTDAPVSSLSRTKQHIEPNMPSSYSNMLAQWNSSSRINQDRKLLIHFGPNSGSGWNTMKTWNRYVFGGSLSTGNSDAAKRIAEEIKEAIPELLRLAS